MLSLPSYLPLEQSLFCKENNPPHTAKILAVWIFEQMYGCYLFTGLNQIPNESTPNAQWTLKQITLIARLKRIKNIICVLFVDVYLFTMNTLKVERV